MRRKKVALLFAATCMVAAISGCQNSTDKGPETITDPGAVVEDTTAVPEEEEAPSSENTDKKNAEEASNEEDVETVKDADDIEKKVGVDMTVPGEENTYSVVAKSIGEVVFTKDGVTYTYRSSKVLASDAMAGINSPMSTESTKETIEDTTVYFSTYEDGTLIAYWSIADTNYTLTCADAEQEQLKCAVEYIMQKE